MKQRTLESAPGFFQTPHGRRIFWIGSSCLLAALGGLAYFYWDAIFPRRTLDLGNIHEQGTRDPLLPPKFNSSAPPEAPPESNLVWIPGGEFNMGDADIDHALPVHRVYVDGFWMSRYEVTNKDFEQFVKETKYLTVAEKPAEVPPHAKGEIVKELVGNAWSSVFSPLPPGVEVDYENPYMWWQPVLDASWRRPEGGKSDLRDRERHPAVHVCYDDALEYCKWKSKETGRSFRLPTEAEWEFAARGGLDRKKFCWGDDMQPDGKWLANVWQGRFPYVNTKADGYLTTAPVGSFPPNGYGLYDMAGNVWEWCLDWYQPDYYRKSPKVNPKGPYTSFDVRETGTPKRVQRGGSFLCSDHYCFQYLPGARHSGEPTSSANHTGFRVICEPKKD